jgi:hypothetical protein
MHSCSVKCLTALSGLMTYEEWSALPYAEQKTALADAVVCAEEWDWDDFGALLGFFEDSPEVDLVVRRFVDITRLRNHYGNAEMNEAGDDMNLDAAQYDAFRHSLFSGLDVRLFDSNESEDLALLEAVHSVFLTREVYRIMAQASDGAQVNLRLTRKCFTDARGAEVVLPWADLEEHDGLDELGEWLEVDGEQVEYVDYTQKAIDSFDDVEVVDDSRLDAQLANSFDDHKEGDEFEVPQYEERLDEEAQGLGDKLFD